MSDLTEIRSALRGHLPFRLYLEEGQWLCNWLFVGEMDFKEPFFGDEIANCRSGMQTNQRMKCSSSLDMLPEWAGCMETIRPDVFIFHVSRCGSTLATQLLSLNPANVALSEVPFFDELLTSQKGEQVERSLQAAISLYGARRKAEQQRLFIKTDSWHIFFHGLIRKLYPETPFILLYRQPQEVIRSQQKIRGMHAVPGLIEPELFGLDRESTLQLTFDEYIHIVLEKYFRSFIDIATNDPLSFPVNYSEGPMAIVQKIATAANFSFTQHEMQQMRQRASYHAKHPKQAFSEETSEPDTGDRPETITELYERLEAIRTGINSYAQ